jgi:hypothetical protein
MFNTGGRKMKKIKHETASTHHGSRGTASRGEQRFSRRALTLLMVHCSLLLALLACPQPNIDDPNDLGYIAIKSAADLRKIGSGPDYPLSGDYRIPAGTRELKLSNWTPIGTEDAPFTGKLSGNGGAVAIESFAAEALSLGRLGLFGVARGAEIKDLAVSISAGALALEGDGAKYAGALAGQVNGGTLRNITVSGTLQVEKSGLGDLHVGGVAGSVHAATIEESASSLTLTAASGRDLYAGGLAGYAEGQTVINNSSALGDISGAAGASSAAYVGGLIGQAAAGLELSHGNYTAGTVTANAYSAYSGGIVGHARGAAISETYASGTVSALGSTPFAGGIAGFLGGGSVKNAYALAEALARSATRRALAGGIAGGALDGAEIAASYTTGKVTAEVTGSLAGPTHGAPEGAYAGGVAGALYGENPAVKSSVVLDGGSVTARDAASGGALNAYRIAAKAAGTLAGNIAWQSLPLVGGSAEDKGADKQDGADTGQAKPGQGFYAELGWDFATIWRMGSGGYPVLAGQSFNFGDYIEITGAEQLAKIGVDNAYPLNGLYRIPAGTADITLSEWKPIGTAEKPFTGSFAGNGATLIRIAGFASGTSEIAAIGLFGYVKGSARQQAELKDLNIAVSMDGAETLTAKAAQYAGGLAGYGETLTVEGCRVDGAMKWNKTSGYPLYSGGLVGYLKNGRILDSSSAAAVESECQAGLYSGGVLGYGNGSLLVSGCVSTGAVAAKAGSHNSSAGGIVGYILGTNDSTVSLCGASGDVSLTSASGREATKLMFYCGGVVGYAGNGTADMGDTERAGAVVEKSRYTGGTVYCRSAYPYAGGVIGYHYTGSEVKECHATGTVTAEGSNLPYAGGVAGYISGAAKVENSYSHAMVNAFSTAKQALAGGIAGATAKPSLLSKCYATGAVAARIDGSGTEDAGGSLGVPHAANAGGISGSLYFANPRVEKSLALNSSVAGTDATSGGTLLVYRIGGASTLDGGQPVLDDNQAWAGMPATGGALADKGPNGQDGEDCGQKPAQEEYAALGWDFGGVWRMGGDYPVLRWEN